MHTKPEVVSRADSDQRSYKRWRRGQIAGLAIMGFGGLINGLALGEGIAAGPSRPHMSVSDHQRQDAALALTELGTGIVLAGGLSYGFAWRESGRYIPPRDASPESADAPTPED